MRELPRNIRDFIVRDIIYIVGGGSILTSFLYRFNRLPNEDTPLAFYLLGAGVSYVVGCSLQDIFSIVRVVTTGPVITPGRFMRWIYRHFTSEEWIEFQEFDPTEVRRALRSLLKNDEARAARYERAITGMILATTMGPCSLVSSLLIFWRWLGSTLRFDLAAASTTLILSLGLFLLARLKAMQVTRIDAEALADFRNLTKETDVNSDV